MSVNMSPRVLNPAVDVASISGSIGGRTMSRTRLPALVVRFGQC